MIMTQGMRQMSMAMKQPAGGPGIQHADAQGVYPALCKGEGQLRIAGEDTEN